MIQHCSRSSSRHRSRNQHLDRQSNHRNHCNHDAEDRVWVAHENDHVEVAHLVVGVLGEAQGVRLDHSQHEDRSKLCVGAIFLIV